MHAWLRVCVQSAANVCVFSCVLKSVLQPCQLRLQGSVLLSLYSSVLHAECCFSSPGFPHGVLQYNGESDVAKCCCYLVFSSSLLHYPCTTCIYSSVHRMHAGVWRHIPWCLRPSVCAPAAAGGCTCGTAGGLHAGQGGCGQVDVHCQGVETHLLTDRVRFVRSHYVQHTYLQK